MDNKQMKSEIGTAGNEAEKTVAPRAWIKPAFEQEPLKEALSGLGTNTEYDGSGCIS